ncbi:MAG: metallophosphoesterase [Cytophagales bacterium]|nr:metallophosphoesterase [Cytophagales bacterium]
MKTLLAIPLVLILLISSCTPDRSLEKPSGTSSNHLNIAVLADIHYMDPSLLKNGAENEEAFQNYLNADPKLVQYSDAIFRKVVADLKAARPDILLVAGDMTKDGEAVSHQAVVALLKQLKDAGTKVFVVPGNHDIQNPEAVAYDGNSTTPAPSVSPQEFVTLYSDFGYGNAISRDPNSLSYISQPHPNLWILGIDDCKYYENVGNIAVIGGNIRPLTMQWIQGQLAVAKKNNIRVLALMHHNLIEHYTGQDQLDPQYVTDNWEANADALIDAGLELIFTGHYHANDVASRSRNGKVLYDVETSSLVDPPLAYRTMTLKNSNLDINSKYVTSINATLPNGLDLTTYSYAFFSAHLDGIFSYLLTQPPFFLSESLAASAAPLFRNAYIAHFNGDEKISPAEQNKDNELAGVSPLAAYALSVLWTDLNPKDNNLHINLRTP